MPNPIVHFEIGCRDREKSTSFYQQLFDWEMTSGPMSTDISTGLDASTGTAISGHIVSLGHEPFHYTNFYVGVSSVAEYLAKAESLGGKTLIPPIKLPNGSTFAWFSDIDGNTIGLLSRE
jgi:predicted enzyme related to lactoylglutathione lyase